MKTGFIGAATGFSLAAACAAAQSTPHEQTTAALAEMGYVLSASAPEAAVTLEGPTGEAWSLPERETRIDLQFNGPADFTGDAVPELIVIARTNRSGGAVHVIELGPDGPALLEERGASRAQIDAFAKLAPGESLDVLGTDTMKAELTPRPPAAERMRELGYSIDRKAPETLRILRNGTPVHSVQSFSIRVHGPAYMSDSADPGLLILSANSRSFSDLVLVELTQDGPEIRVSENGFTRDMNDIFEEAIDRVQAGQPALDPARPGPIKRPELLELPDLELPD